MKILVFLIILFSLSNSANLLYLEKKNNKGVQTYCIDTYSYDRNRMYFYDLKSNYERNISTTAYQKILVIGGYELNSYNDCIFDESKYLGLTYEQYHYSMALYGIFLSFLISLALILAV